MAVTRPEVWWNDEQYAAWEARMGHVDATHDKYPLTGIEYPVEPLTGDASKRVTVDPDMAERMRKERDLADAYLRKKQFRLSDPSRYDPALDPFASTMTKIRCCWCGVQDRHEFFQSTVYFSVDEDVHFECKASTECAGRVALSAGRHQ